MSNLKKMAVNLIAKAIDESAQLEVSNDKYHISARKITFQMVEDIIYVWLQEKKCLARNGKIGPVIEIYCGGNAGKAAEHFIKYAGYRDSIGVALKYFRDN